MKTVVCDICGKRMDDFASHCKGIYANELLPFHPLWDAKTGVYTSHPLEKYHNRFHLRVELTPADKADICIDCMWNFVCDLLKARNDAKCT